MNRDINWDRDSVECLKGIPQFLTHASFDPIPLLYTVVGRNIVSKQYTDNMLLPDTGHLRGMSFPYYRTSPYKAPLTDAGLNDLCDCYCNEVLTLRLNKPNGSFKCYTSDSLILDGTFRLDYNTLLLTDRLSKQTFVLYINETKSLDASSLPGFGNNQFIPCSNVTK